jgi:hypothetical protein
MQLAVYLQSQRQTAHASVIYSSKQCNIYISQQNTGLRCTFDIHL